MSGTPTPARATKLTEEKANELRLNGLSFIKVEGVEYAVPTVAFSLCPYRVQLPDESFANYDGYWIKETK